MNKEIEINGYLIKIGFNEKYNSIDLPEELCRKICKVHDAGKQFSPSSRFTFSVKGFNNYKGIHLGTAKAVIQLIAIKKLNHQKGEKYSITKTL